MKSTKIYQVMEKLDIYELNRFTKFVNSPYFNVKKSLIQLNVLIQTILKGKNGGLTKQMIWKKIFVSPPYNDTKFRKLCTDLLKLSERFLAQEIYDKNPINQAAYLIEAISSHKIEKLYNSAWNSAQRLIERQLERASSYYYYQYQLEKNYYYLAEFELHRDKEINVALIADYLDKFYIAEKLRYLNLANSQRNVVKKEYKMRFINEITNLIQSGEFADIPEIAIYNQILLLQNDSEEESHYIKLKELIKKHIHLFPQLEARDIYYVAVNYCIKMSNSGRPEYLRELFINYQELINTDLIYVQDELTPWSFKNIVLTGVRLNEFDWAEKFIENYQEKLNFKQRQNAVTFNLARLNYYKKDFNKVISLLQEVEFSDISYNLSSKALLLASYYELDEFDALEKFLNTFRTFLNRNKKKITEQRRNNYLNLIKYVKKLINLFPNDKAAIKALIEEVKTGISIADKRWLLKKLDELH